MQQCYRQDMQLALYSIGDPGHRVRAAAHERAIRQGGSTALRHRIEHAIMATPEQIARAADMKLIFSVQPAYAYLWGGKGRYVRAPGGRALSALQQLCRHVRRRRGGVRRVGQRRDGAAVPCWASTRR